MVVFFPLAQDVSHKNNDYFLNEIEWVPVRKEEKNACGSEASKSKGHSEPCQRQTAVRRDTYFLHNLES